MKNLVLFAVFMMLSLSVGFAQHSPGWDGFVTYVPGSTITFINEANTTIDGVLYPLENELSVHYFGKEGIDTYCGAEGLALKAFEMRTVQKWCDGVVVVIHKEGRDVGVRSEQGPVTVRSRGAASVRRGGGQ